MTRDDVMRAAGWNACLDAMEGCDGKCLTTRSGSTS